MNDNATKYDILKTELELTQRQVDKYDTLSTTVKSWAVTLWAASVGWSFQVHRPDIFLVGILIVIVFWFFDAMNKTLRWDYANRRDEVADVLAFIFKTGKVPEETTAPKLPDHEMLRGAFKGFFMFHIALPYLILVLVSVFLFINGGI